MKIQFQPKGKHIEMGARVSEIGKYDYPNG